MNVIKTAPSVGKNTQSLCPKKQAKYTKPKWTVSQVVLVGAIYLMLWVLGYFIGAAVQVVL